MLKTAYSSYQTTGTISSPITPNLETGAPFGQLQAGSPTSGDSRKYSGTQMIVGPCLIKRIYCWNENDGPVSVFLHDGHGTNITYGDLPPHILYKIGAQSEFLLNVPEPGFLMKSGLFFRHGNTSATSFGRVHATITYEPLGQFESQQYHVQGVATPTDP